MAPFLDKAAKLLVILIFFSVTFMLIELTDQSEMTLLASSSMEQTENFIPASDSYPPPLPTKALLTPYPPPTSPPPPPPYPSPTTSATVSPIPTVTPTFPPVEGIEFGTRQVIAWLDYRSKEALPEYKIVVDTHPKHALLKTRPQIKQFTGELKWNEEHIKREKEHKANTTGEWEVLVSENFEGPSAVENRCSFHDASDDRFERYWGADDLRAFNGSQAAAHPAKGGADGISPAKEQYPPNLDSWLLCGPFMIDETERLMVEFAFLTEKVKDIGDSFFFGVSTDGQSFQGSEWDIHRRQWFVRLEEIKGVQGELVWLGWAFQSDEDGTDGEGTSIDDSHEDGISDEAVAIDDSHENGISGEGPWIDDIKVWRIGTPVFTRKPGGEASECDELGGRPEKGMVLEPVHPSSSNDGTATPIPIISDEHSPVLQKLKAINTQWVRIEFKRDLFVDTQKYSDMFQVYDKIVNTLCGDQIHVLGLLDYETLDNRDFNSDNDDLAAAYRDEFSSMAAVIAYHYSQSGTIRHWEIWNEPDLPGENFIKPELYKPLVTQGYYSITNTVPNARILSGGLSTAWDGSYTYFVSAYDSNIVFTEFEFDHFAIHPYPDIEPSNNPSIYMYYTTEPRYKTILDRFLEKILLEGDGLYRDPWITEIGWNSSKGSSIASPCHEALLVNRTEQSQFLLDSFDILFNEVKRWGTSISAVDKIIWYQYMDVGITLAGACPHLTPSPGVPTPEAVDWSYGLYDANQEPKSSACAFKHYPRRPCEQYFPVILGDGPSRTK